MPAHRSRKRGVPGPLASRPNHLFMNIVLAVGFSGLLLAIAELGMRYLDRPRTVISGSPEAGVQVGVDSPGLLDDIDATGYLALARREQSGGLFCDQFALVGV